MARVKDPTANQHAKHDDDAGIAYTTHLLTCPDIHNVYQAPRLATSIPIFHRDPKNDHVEPLHGPRLRSPEPCPFAFNCNRIESASAAMVLASVMVLWLVLALILCTVSVLVMVLSFIPNLRLPSERLRNVVELRFLYS